MRKLIVLGLIIFIFTSCSKPNKLKETYIEKNEVEIISNKIQTEEIIATIKNNSNHSIFYDSQKDRLEVKENGKWRNLTLGHPDIGLNMEIPKNESEQTTFNLSTYSLELRKEYRIVYTFNKERYNETNSVEYYLEFKL